jgi:aerobic-type carbon monoxide dehydrogenase small subunit (CoxS/CutS family)
MRFELNGKSVDVSSPPLTRLLDVLRGELGLTGTKEGCGEGECGACTVLVDGEAVCSCLVPVAQAAGRRVLTIEGVRSKVQDAFVTKGGAQCGICTPGMILMSLALRKGATLAEIREGLAGNLCRCTGYMGIYRALGRAQAQVTVQSPKSKVQSRKRRKI